MNQRDGAPGSNNGRMQWGGYGFLAGILVGVLMGWMFAGFVGAVIRVAMLAAVVVPLVLAYVAWRRFIRPWLQPRVAQPEIGPLDAIETRAVVHNTVIRDAEDRYSSPQSVLTP